MPRKRQRVVAIRDRYLAVWRSLYAWFARTRGESGADVYTASAMGAASFFQLMAIGWILQSTGVFDLAILLRDRKFLVIVVVLLMMIGHFYVARYLENSTRDRARITDAKPASARLGLTYLVGSALIYLTMVAVAFVIRWH
jgi:hypothetical protein